MIDGYGSDTRTPRKGRTMATTKTDRDVRAPKTNKAGRYRQTPEYVGFVRRAIRALTTRVGVEADIEGLPAMLDLQRQLDESIGVAVAGLRTAGYSWAEIGSRIGMTRQGAQQRWGRDAHRHQAARVDTCTATATAPTI